MRRCGRSSPPNGWVYAFYRKQIEAADQVLDRHSLDLKPALDHGIPGLEPFPDLRHVVLHMIEETSRHAGHLDLARELIDGRTGMGAR